MELMRSSKATRADTISYDFSASVDLLGVISTRRSWLFIRAPHSWKTPHTTILAMSMLIYRSTRHTLNGLSRSFRCAPVLASPPATFMKAITRNFAFGAQTASIKSVTQHNWFGVNATKQSTAMLSSDTEGRTGMHKRPLG